jgi:hypothetical protein
MQILLIIILTFYRLTLSQIIIKTPYQENTLENVLIDQLKINLIFKFDTEILEFLSNNSFDSLKIKLRKFNGNDTIVKHVNIIYHPNNNKTTTKDNITEVLYNDSNLLNEVNLYLKQYGDYILCYVFINNNNELVSFHTSNMCIDIAAHDTGVVVEPFKYSYYKPLFIPIMYTLCALMLLPVVIWKNLVAKAKKYKAKQQQQQQTQQHAQPPVQQETQQKDNQTNIQNSISESLSSYNKLLTLLNNDDLYRDQESSEPLLANCPKVHFDACSLNEEEDSSEKIDADHILNSKPWLNNEKIKPLTDSRSTEMNFSTTKLVFSLPVDFNEWGVKDFESSLQKKNKKKHTLTKTVSFMPIDQISSNYITIKASNSVEFDIKIENENLLSARNKENHPEHQQKQKSHYFSYESNV